MALFTITTLCNNNCSSCINFKNNRLSHFEMEKIISKAESATKDGDIHFCINGGEPTIHPRFFEIISTLASYNTELLLLTNARAFSNNDFTKNFNNIDFDKKKTKIAVALYGYDEKTHDSVTRSPKSFIQTISGIKNLTQLGFDIEIRIIITKQNYKILHKITEYSLKNLYPYRIAFISMKLTGEAYDLKKHIAVKITETIVNVEKSVKLIEEYNKNHNTNSQFDDTNKNNRNEIDIRLFHFPHCTIKKGLWKYTLGKTIDDDELIILEECKKCSKKKVCSLPWKSYVDVFGNEEFKRL